MQSPDLMTMISQVGFPIAVAAYVLIRMEMKMGKLTDAIMALAAKVGGQDNGSK